MIQRQYLQWALQMLLKAEKHHKNIKLIAITTVNGNTTTDNVIKNTYRILDGLDRTDVSISAFVHFCYCFCGFLS